MTNEKIIEELQKNDNPEDFAGLCVFQSLATERWEFNGSAGCACGVTLRASRVEESDGAVYWYEFQPTDEPEHRVKRLRASGMQRKKKENKMEHITKEKLIVAGGKLWTKKNLERVYLDDKTIAVAFGMELVSMPKWSNQFKSIGKAKVWFDCQTETLHANKGMVRVMFNQNNIDCVA